MWIEKKNPMEAFHNLKDVDVDGTSNHSDSNSRSSQNDVQMVLSSSSHHRPQEAWNEDDDGQLERVVTPKQLQETRNPLPILVFAWHLMARATLGVFLILNDSDNHQDTSSLIFLAATTFSMLNILLLSVLKPRKHNYVSSAFAVYSSTEACVLVLFPDFVLYTLPVLIGAWMFLFLLSLNPCRPIYRWYYSRPLKNTFLYRREVPVFCLLRHKYFYIRMFWALFLSIVSEASNLFYFWFLMHGLEHEVNERKQRIILCCINLKLLFTSYSRHMLFERKFSYLAMISEFFLFAITSSIVYVYTFLKLTNEQSLILKYTFWSALGLEIIVNFIMFARFSTHVF